MKCRIKKFFLLALAAACCMGCGTTRHTVSDIGRRDSLVIHVVDSVIYRDSIIHVQLPEEHSVGVVQDSDTSCLETSIARSTAWVSLGKLHHELENKDVAWPVPVVVKNYLKTETRDHLQIQWREIPVEQELSDWEVFLINLGKITIILAFIWAIRTLARLTKR